MAGKRYIGITIGPIFDTMNMSSSPVALWASSYMFSTLSKTLCRLIVESGVSQKNIITPYYSSEDTLISKNDGVGLFNDRIIFNVEGFDAQKLNDIKDAAIAELADLTNLSKDYLKSYVAISSAVFFADSPLVKSNKVLDNLELEKKYIYKEESSPLLALFNGDKYSHNRELLKTKMINNLSSFQLRDTDGSIKSLDEIVSTGTGAKKYNYYAIVRSDGDNMGRIAESMTTDEQAREFSRVCLEYCSEVADEVAKFNGVTIYSGGDDLLAILPCESHDGKTPFDFVARAQEIFASHFDKYKKEASLSFGILMAHYKSPLFETLEASETLLFDIAKKDKKSRLALQLQRPSGQTEGLIITNDKLGVFIDLLNHIKTSYSTNIPLREAVLSAAEKFNLYEPVFNGAANYDDITNAITNIFNTNSYRNIPFFTTFLPEFFVSAIMSEGISALTNEGIQKSNLALTMRYVLRIYRFLISKGGDE